VHVHSLEPSDPAADDYLLRDRLRVDAADRQRYENTKVALAARAWPYMNAKAKAKAKR
jgi:GrpB-like predicted nucleotidyltransferase (UPF0157 family)